MQAAPYAVSVIALAGSVAAGCVLVGCRSNGEPPTTMPAATVAAASEESSPRFSEPRSFMLRTSLDGSEISAPIYDGDSGDPVWADRMIERMRDADVVLLGEMHTDAAGHALKAPLTATLLRDGGALSLEMLETPDTDAAAQVANVSPTQDALARHFDDTSLADWRNWESSYLPAIVTAARLNRPIVAANAPRVVVRLARLEGYAALEKENTWYPGDFALPEDDEVAALEEYRRRFGRAMSGHDAAAQAVTSADEQATTQPVGATPLPADPMPEMDLDAFFRAQLVWDSTMASRIAGAVDRSDGGPVLHFVGSFHSDYNGALATMLRGRDLNVVTVSVVPADANRLAPGDEGRADYVIYTGPLDRAQGMPPLPEEAGDGPDARKPPVLGEGPLAPSTMPVEPLAPAARPTVFD